MSFLKREHRVRRGYTEASLVKELEKRGAKLRKELTKRFDKIDTPAFDEVVDDAKEQFNKLQDQIEDAVDSVKERISKAA